jgi:predicted glycoside hydrolase/deacetylase ChbG (UPF0249 family)
MPSSTRLIVNADDLGLSEAVNEGVFAAHEEGIVTSTSLMVPRPAAAGAVAALAEHPSLAVGLHLEVEEGGSEVSSRAFERSSAASRLTSAATRRRARSRPPPTTPSAKSSWRRFAIQG